jgi:hypothetical protein
MSKKIQKTMVSFGILFFVFIVFFLLLKFFTVPNTGTVLTTSNSEALDWITYTNTKYGYSLQYPKNVYEISTNPLDTSSPSISTASLIILEKRNSGEEKILINNIDLSHISQSLTFKKFVEDQITEEKKRSKNPVFASTTVKNLAEFGLGGRSGLVFEVHSNVYESTWHFFVQNGQYIMTIEATLPFNTISERILDSFSFFK